jgi:small subunit ribosomal protein S6
MLKSTRPCNERLSITNALSFFLLTAIELWAIPEKAAKGENTRVMSEQATNSYELIYIIQPKLDEDGINGVNERVAQSIAGQDGQVVSSEVWGQRKLAYPIKNHFLGYYILHDVEIPPGGVKEVERVMRLHEDIIRFMFMRKDDKIDEVEETEEGGEE